MRYAIISLTRKGNALSREIAAALECDRYAFEKHPESGAVSFRSLSGLITEIFGKYDGLIFISAVGIAVRVTAPHIRSKFTDPAVVAVDEGGKFSVSVLSGHVGGANALAEKIAEITGAVPVITTATDVGRSFSPDSFAAANGLCVLEPELAKEIAAAVTDGGAVGFYSDYEVRNLPDGVFTDGELGVCVSGEMKAPFPRTLHLAPANIVIGIGCKKGVETEALSSFITETLKKAGIHPSRVAEAATIDLKRDEKAILEYCKANGLPLRFYTAEELMAVEGDFARSDFVMAMTGADNVCERSAALGGNRLILRRTALNGMTLAAAEREIDLDYERRPL